MKPVGTTTRLRKMRRQYMDKHRKASERHIKYLEGVRSDYMERHGVAARPWLNNMKSADWDAYRAWVRAWRDAINAEIERRKAAKEPGERRTRSGKKYREMQERGQVQGDQGADVRLPRVLGQVERKTPGRDYDIVWLEEPGIIDDECANDNQWRQRYGPGGIS